MDWTRITGKISKLLLSQKGLVVEFEYNGKFHTGARSIMRKEVVATDAGLADEYVFSLLVPVSELDTIPEPRTDKITVNGVAYRVLDVEKDAIEATVKLHLGGEWA